MGSCEWERCFICQAKKDKKLLDPSLSFKLKSSKDILLACYQEVLGNIRELADLGVLPDFVVARDICGGADGGSGGDGSGFEAGGWNAYANLIQSMKDNKVLWHKSCRTSIDSQKVEWARKKHEQFASPAKTRRMLSGSKSTMQAACSDPEI